LRINVLLKILKNLNTIGVNIVFAISSNKNVKDKNVDESIEIGKKIEITQIKKAFNIVAQKPINAGRKIPFKFNVLLNTPQM